MQRQRPRRIRSCLLVGGRYPSGIGLAVAASAVAVLCPLLPAPSRLGVLGPTGFPPREP
jgi:hypothetical protein